MCQFMENVPSQRPKMGTIRPVLRPFMIFSPFLPWPTSCRITAIPAICVFAWDEQRAARDAMGPSRTSSGEQRVFQQRNMLVSGIFQDQLDGNLLRPGLRRMVAPFPSLLRWNHTSDSERGGKESGHIPLMPPCDASYNVRPVSFPKEKAVPSCHLSLSFRVYR